MEGVRQPFLFRVIKRDMERHLRFESAAELLEGNDSVSVLVELTEHVDSVVLQGGVPAGGLLDLQDDVLKGGFGELVWVVLHVLFGVFVGGDELEFESSQVRGAANEEVLLLVVGLCDGRSVLLALHELSTGAAAVFVAHFVDLDGVVSAVEGNNETAVFVIGLGGNQFRVETEDVHVLLKHLLHVELRGLGLESNNAAQGVLFSSVAGVRRHGLVLDARRSLLELDRHLVVVEAVFVPLLGAIVAVVDKAVSSKN